MHELNELLNTANQFFGTYCKQATEPPKQSQADWLRAIPLDTFYHDGSDILLCYMDASDSELLELLADAQQALDDQSTQSPEFKNASAKIVEALLRSAQNYREVTQQ